MTKSVTIMNFSGIYEKESFYKDMDYQWIELKDIRGTNCYCDEAAQGKLTGILKSYTPYGIHFIDSGNYHYTTKFWTAKLTRPFSLIVFDHHTDMQSPAFGDILSCGSWVRNLLVTCPNLVKIYLIGMPEKVCYFAGREKHKKLIWISEEKFMAGDNWKGFFQTSLKEPVYISVDKDILTEKTVKTNWDQGNVTIDKLEEALETILGNCPVLGMDVCGEYIYREYSKEKESILAGQYYKMHDKINRLLLECYLNTESNLLWKIN
ncbi:arginase family protein [Anaerocolumna jejuensis]|uniref:arginase family protein n=1 Tax=Anaerocolumna jejuensis TaxID=259063 RepID=UPI003F7C03E3